MKTVMSFAILLFSIASLASSKEGYVQKIVEDDEGLKVVIARSLGHAKADKGTIKTMYMSNNQPDFMATKQQLLNSKELGQRVFLQKENNKLMAIPVGK